MYKIDKGKVKKILVEELGYSEAKAESFLETYPPTVHDELAEAVKRYLEDRTITDVSVHGLSIQELMKVQQCHFFLALSYLNRILDEDITDKDDLVRLLRKPPVSW